jgi:1-acyl-sn-glycerol-3-phosphate acyltransferase
MIKRAGRNIYPHELEEAIGDLPGIRKGCVAVFGCADPETRTERVVVVAETRVTDLAGREELRRRIDEITVLVLEAAADDVVLAPPHTVPKTSSGKLRRSACRELYEAGELRGRPRAVSLQVARLAASGVRERARSAVRRAADLGYSAAWWILLALVGVIVWPLIVVLPRREWRWALLHHAGRGFLRVTATQFRVDGAEHVPAHGGAVLVANHSSYLDGLVLAGALRRPARFVAKQELASQRVAGPFLRRLGALFVERFDFERGVSDAQRTGAAASHGDLVVFFPEGTLRREPGLQHFHLGAFVTAAGAGACVVPAAVRGPRGILRAEHWFARRGAISVQIGEPLWPKGSDWASALDLRERAYAWLLANCGESAARVS